MRANLKFNFPSIFGDDIEAIKNWRSAEKEGGHEKVLASRITATKHISSRILVLFQKSNMYRWMVPILQKKRLSSRSKDITEGQVDSLLDGIVFYYLIDNRENDFITARAPAQCHVLPKGSVPEKVIDGQIPIDALHANISFRIRETDEAVLVNFSEMKHGLILSTIPMEKTMA